MCNWINKTNVDEAAGLPRQAKAIKVIDHSIISKGRESSCESKEDHELNKSFHSISGLENLGRNKGVLSGCSTKRRQATFGVLTKDFNEAIKS